MTQLIHASSPAMEPAKSTLTPGPATPKESASPTRLARLDALTSLRFVAAAMIVLHHTPGFFGLPYAWLEPLPLDHGVSFFFVLSGFILAYVYPALSWRSAPRFWWARIARLWPAHLISFLLVLILLSPGGLAPTDSVTTAIPNLLLIHGWIPIDAFFFSFNFPSWSISTEFGFYLLFPFLIAGFRHNWIWKLGLAMLLLIAMIALGNRYTGLTLFAGYQLNMHGLVYINPLARLFEFVLGMCTWLLWQRLRQSTRLSVGWCTAGEIAALGLTVLLMYGSAVGAPLWVSTLGEAGKDWFLHGGGSAVGFAAIILFVAMDRGLGARFLRLPAFVLLGEISYSVYLVHQVMLRAIGGAPWFRAAPIELSFPLFWVSMVMVAYLIWRFVERPVRLFLVGLTGGSATQPTAIRIWRQAVNDGPGLRTVAASFLCVAVCAALTIWIEVQSPKHAMWQEFFRPPGPEAPVAQIEVAAPKRWTIERRQTYLVKATNIGERTWYAAQPAQVFLHVMFVGPGDLDRVDERVEVRMPITAPVSPGGQLEMQVTVMAPRKEGSYRLRHQVEIDPYYGVETQSVDEMSVVVGTRGGTASDGSP